MTPAPALKDYLAEHTTPETGAAILGLSAAAADIATRLAGFGSGPALEAEADAAIAARLAPVGVRFLASRRQGGVSQVNPNGSLAAAIEPLGPTAIETDTPPGTLFSLYPAAPGEPEASFLRPGTDQTAAGYILYGPRTTLALTTGQGTALFLLDRETGSFRCHTPEIRIPAGTAEFAANAAEYRHWERPIQRFIDDCLSGDEGPRARNFDMRWTGSLAAETQRILLRGGVYLAPRGAPAPLRLIHHCHPVALLIEQAGGRATDGLIRLLDQAAATLDTTSPLVFGSPGKVARVAAYHDLPDSEASPLFGQRGLFRL
jgi:fructose-1,6-bisphosphatase I